MHNVFHESQKHYYQSIYGQFWYDPIRDLTFPIDAVEGTPGNTKADREAKMAHMFDETGRKWRQQVDDSILAALEKVAKEYKYNPPPDTLYRRCVILQSAVCDVFVAISHVLHLAEIVAALNRKLQALNRWLRTKVPEKQPERKTQLPDASRLFRVSEDDTFRCCAAIEVDGTIYRCAFEPGHRDPHETKSGQTTWRDGGHLHRRTVGRVHEPASGCCEAAIVVSGVRYRCSMDTGHTGNHESGCDPWPDPHYRERDLLK